MILASHARILRKRLAHSTRASLLLGALLACASCHAQRPHADAPRVVWPTPSTAYAEGRPLTEYVQPTESGLLESGLYGCTRSGGRQFHEGLDLFPVKRDKRGEATDPVFAAMAGVVRHVARGANGGYGRYVVLEHPDQTPAVYTLYAHLAKIADGVKPGLAVAAGDTLGTMGRSAGGYTIPRERAHLHFEIGLRASDFFQRWYDARGFGSTNEHGLYNGMNLLGLDPLEFFRLHAEGRLRSLGDLVAAQPVAVTAHVARPPEPDFARRYPSLVTNPDAAIIGGGWEVAFNRMGVPVRLRRLEPSELADTPRGGWRVVSHDAEALATCRCRRLVRTVKGQVEPGEDLRSTLELIFGPAGK